MSQLSLSGYIYFLKQEDILFLLFSVIWRRTSKVGGSLKRKRARESEH